MKNIGLLITTIGLGLVLVACEEKGPAEKLGEKVDDTFSSLSDKAKDAVDDVGDALKDACEEAKEQAGAENTDC